MTPSEYSQTIARARKVVTSKVIPKLSKGEGDKQTRASLSDGELRFSFVTGRVGALIDWLID